jgi:hypothetical protein
LAHIRWQQKDRLDKRGAIHWASGSTIQLFLNVIYQHTSPGRIVVEKRRDWRANPDTD